MLAEEQERRQGQAQALLEDGEIGGRTLHQEAAQRQEEVSQGNSYRSNFNKVAAMAVAAQESAQGALPGVGEQERGHQV